MSDVKAGWVIALLGVLVGLLSFDTFGTNLGVAQSWEYRLESPSDWSFESELNKFGQEGWELVFARRATNSSGSASYEMILKRPRGL